MPINALIAQGVEPIGRDLPQIAQMLNQKKQAEYENQRRNALLQMEQEQMDYAREQGNWQRGRANALDQKTAQEEKTKQALAKVRWILQSGASKQQMEQSIPEIAGGYEGLHGPGSWAAASDDDVRRSAEDAEAKLASSLGEGPQSQWKDDTRQGFAGQTEVGTNKFDPYPQKNAGSGGNPYYTAVYTADGVSAFDNRTGQIAPAGGPGGGGKDVRRTVDDPTVQADIAGATKSAQLNSERQQHISVAIQNTKSSDQLLDMASPLARAATGSYVGAGVDFLSNVFGFAPKGDEAISALQGIQAQLILMVPRMEGPQGVLDLKLYEAAAGEIGNPRVPTANKMAAIRTIRALNAKYRELNPQSSAQAPANAQPRSFASEAEAEAANIPRGTRVIINGVPGTWQ